MLDYFEEIGKSFFSALLGGVAVSFFMSEKPSYLIMIGIVIVSALGLVIIKYVSEKRRA